MCVNSWTNLVCVDKAERLNWGSLNTSLRPLWVPLYHAHIYVTQFGRQREMSKPCESSRVNVPFCFTFITLYQSLLCTVRFLDRFLGLRNLGGVPMNYGFVHP